MSILRGRAPSAPSARASTGPVTDHYPEATAQPVSQISADSRHRATAVALLITALSGIAYTISSAAAPAIVSDLNGFHLYGWVIAGYALASTISLPIIGKLSDVYGRRPLLLWSLALFGLGAILAGLSTTMPWLIVSMMISGSGGGGMFALAAATIADAFPPRERARWLGMASTTYGITAIFGPTLGGVITDRLGWRWVFLALAPLAALMWLFVATSLPRFGVRGKRQLDLLGSTLLAGGLVAVMLAFTWSGARYRWSSWQDLVTLATGLLLLALFVCVERRVAAPLLSPVLFQNPVFTLCVVASFVMTGAWYAALTFTPLYVQGVAAHSAARSGLIVAPMMAAFAIAALTSGYLITRIGEHRPLSVTGAALLIAGFATFLQLSPTSSFTLAGVAMALAGLGVGLLTPVLTIGVQASFAHAVVGTVSSARNLFASMGSATLVPLMTAVLVTNFRDELQTHLPSSIRPVITAGRLDPQRLVTARSQQQLSSRVSNLPNGHELYREFLDALHAALMSGISDIYWLGLGLSCVVFLIVLVMPRFNL
jgi:EmrB/QacA subfamily drug resistance transporter